jgi:hypothetical protein
MRIAHTPKLFLWPRFQVHVARDLSAQSPEVIELTAPLTPLMVSVQRAIVECMDNCLDELKRSSHVDVTELTRENGLFERFDLSVRRQLQPVWNTLKPKTRLVVTDLRVLRKLLGYLLRYDALTFFEFLDKLRFDAVQAATAARTGIAPAARESDGHGGRHGGREGGNAGAASRGPAGMPVLPPSEWLLSDAGERLYKAAKARIFAVVDHGSSSSSDAVGSEVRVMAIFDCLSCYYSL